LYYFDKKEDGMKNIFSLLLVMIFIMIISGTPIVGQTAEIQFGYFQESSYVQGEPVYFSVKVKNTGTTTLSGLWLNVDISNPNGTNVREGWWQDIPTLSPNATYTTGYDYVWTVTSNATLGNYSAAVGLRDAATVYDIEYNIDNFTVLQANPDAEISWGYIQNNNYEPGETVKLNVKVKNIGNVILTGLWLNVDIAAPNGSNVVEGYWQIVETLDPNETYETGYDYIWEVAYNAQLGTYYATVGLRDNSIIYDIEYNIDNFDVIAGTANAEILFGDIENDTYNIGETVKLKVEVKNTGNTILNGLWLNVDISNPNGTNVREGWWQDLPELYPDETYDTGYDDVWTIPTNAISGNYSVAGGLRDNATIYDIKYGIDQFNVLDLPPFPITTGKLLFHNYSGYWNWDGKLYLFDFANSTLEEISSNWNIDHTINGHFSPDGTKIVFMGVPEGSHSYDSFDIYLWEIGTSTPINLTYGNGLPDEDPKFSPYGHQIVFKHNGDIKIMDLNGSIIYNVTNDGPGMQESMPYFTDDGLKIIYSRDASNLADIYIINIDGSNNLPLENVTNVQEYYPITMNSSTYLYTRWVSTSNEHDQIYKGSFTGAGAERLDLNNENVESADPYPVGTDYLIFSSIRSSGMGEYDLYIGEINSGLVWSMNQNGINTGLKELGACYFNEIPLISVTVGTNPNERTFTVDGQTYTSTQQLSWMPGTLHTIGTTTPQDGTAGTQYVFNNWSDGGALIHTVTPTSNITFTANFDTEYFLTMTAGTNGTVNPPSGWRTSGSVVEVTANANSGYYFGEWIGSGSGSYTGTNNPAQVTMNEPIEEIANFSQNITIYVGTNPEERSFTVDGSTYTALQQFSWIPNTQHTIGTTTPQNDTTGVRFVFTNWSDGGEITHTVSPGSSNTYTANFDTEYYLTMIAETGGTVSPQSGWQISGNTVEIFATADSGYYFGGWIGSGNGSYTGDSNLVQINMHEPITETANFVVTTVEDFTSIKPQEYKLYQNYPNPFNPISTIEFSLKEESYTKLTVYSISGEEVKSLLNNESLPAGIYRLNFDASDLPSGIYFYRLQAGSFVDTKKMILLK
jgi:Divergent InlB B-repeat domain/Secretion system C-terminal sorting domain